MITKFKKIDEWEVLTPNGWSDIEGVSKIQKPSYIKIIFNNNSWIKCSNNHKLKLLNGEFIYAKDIKRGMEFEGKNKTSFIVKSTRKINKKIYLYDLNNVKKNNEFYSNDIISHNCALIDDAGDLWSSASPTLSTGGRSILLSTPRGVGSFFHKMWQGAEENNNGTVGTNGFHPIKLPWNLHPDRDDTWREVEGGKQPSPKEAAREFDCDFATSGDNVIDLGIIEFYKKNKARDPLDIRGIDRGLWVWEYVDYNHSYVVCADPARGDGADFSACHVLDVSLEKPTQVAEYKGNLGTKDFGNFLVALATEYNNALLIVERENVGWAVLQQIIDREYKNTFYSSADLKYVDVQRQLSNRYDSDEKKLVPGFSTNMKTRPLVINNLELYFRNMSIEIISKRTLAELETFIWKNGKAIAMEGYHDDLILSLGIGLWVRDTAIRLRQEGIDLMKASVGNIGMKKMDQTPFYKTRQAQIGAEAWTMKTGRTGFGNQTQEDLRWLLK